MSLFDSATAWVERKLVYEGNCQKFVAVSKLTRDIFLNEYEIDSDKVVVINPGVDLNDYGKQNINSVRNSIRGEFGIGIKDTVILFVSMNFEIKGLDDVLFSLAKLKAQNKNFKLVIAGKGNIKKYTKLIRDMGMISDVIFTGPVSKEKLINMYTAGDIYIMLSKFDTFGMVVLEAMAAGLPVVISGNVGARDIVREGVNGFVVEDTNDSDYIAAKIVSLLDESTRKKMSAAAIQTACQNTWDSVAAKYRNIYSGIIERKIKM
jgi:UDP-glucose:(heptosyl)LPS alpha-1,3-glucosyltransferase